jgi:CO/xanthine dehydrogenase Mo-binding subunit
MDTAPPPPGAATRLPSRPRNGIGETGVVGTAAAVANTAHHATGIRVRDLPLTPDKFIR